MTFYITNARAIVACDGLVDSVDSGGAGSMKWYAGTIPTDADAALGGQTLLGTLGMSNPAFGNAVDVSPGAQATANAISDDTSADNTGTASFYRMQNGSGTVVWQGGIGTSGQELNLNTTSIVAGARLSCTSMTVTFPES